MAMTISEISRGLAAHLATSPVRFRHDGAGNFYFSADYAKAAADAGEAAHAWLTDACGERAFRAIVTRGYKVWQTDAGTFRAGVAVSRTVEEAEWAEAEANQAKVDAADKGYRPYDC